MSAPIAPSPRLSSGKRTGAAATAVPEPPSSERGLSPFAETALDGWVARYPAEQLKMKTGELRPEKELEAFEYLEELGIPVGSAVSAALHQKVAHVRRSNPLPQAISDLYEEGWTAPADPEKYERLVELGDKVVMPLLAKTEVEGLQHIPEKGPGLMVLNHRSLMDPVFVGTALSRTGRTPRFLAMHDLWGGVYKGLGVSRLMRMGAHIPVARGTAVAKESLRLAEQALAAGELTAIYPGGGIVKSASGLPDTLKSGAARTALRTGVPVIPAVHRGTDRIFAPSLGKAKLELVVGPPIPLAPPQTPGEPSEVEVDAASKLILETLQGMTDELNGRS